MENKPMKPREYWWRWHKKFEDQREQVRKDHESGEEFRGILIFLLIMVLISGVLPAMLRSCEPPAIPVKVVH